MSSVERRVLLALVQVSEGGDDLIEVDRIVRAANLDAVSVQRALRALSSYGDLFFQSVLDPDCRVVVFVHHVTAHARRATQGATLAGFDDIDAASGSSGSKLLVGRMVKVVGAVLGAAVAKVIATFVIHEIDRR
ncbi:hypothetical protein [Micromonospora sp. NPDC050276]|uniref:hypothetical protein n=1 Tax=Micromonospora sp. NPDC050276 TaxID=3364278 RepID=UPI003795E6DC